MLCVYAQTMEVFIPLYH